MYKIYIGSHPIILTDHSTINQIKYAKENCLWVDYSNQNDYLLGCIDSLEKETKQYEAIIIQTDQIEQLWSDFKALYHVIEAAGGLVFNESKAVLAIYRRGYWDLPKGKIDKGESPEEAAIREVQEETGLFQLSLGSPICVTYHTYLDPYKNNRRTLKKTYWYQMATIEEQLKPQLEEDIEQAVWLDYQDFKTRTPIFNNILDVLHQFDS